MTPRLVTASGPGMSVLSMRAELRRCTVRTRRTMAASALFHAALLAWLILMPHTSSDSLPLTEITLLDAGDLAASPSPAGEPAPGPRPTAGVPTTKSPDVRFVRTTATGVSAPVPQSWTSAGDRLNDRLEALQSDALTRAQGISTAPGSGPSWNAAGIKGVEGGIGNAAGTVALNRGGGGGSGSPIALTRGGASGIGTAPALTPTAPAEPSPASAPARGGDRGARRSLAGATLMGPIADRPILSIVKPVYPDWAKRDAVEGSVTLYFVVRPDGSVKENVLVQKTAGFEDFDENARTALKDWRFEPLHGGRTGEQWGTITFHFRLRDSG